MDLPARPEDRPVTAKKACFVISPIGDDASDARREADWLLKGIIYPAIGEEFEVRRADNYPKTDLITNQVIQAIKNADLIVADLTDHNPNVFYELGVAHTFEKKVIPMIRKPQRLPFDNQPMNTIFYSRERFEDIGIAIAQLKEATAETLRSNVSNPVTVALGLGNLQASGDSRDQVIADLSVKVGRLSRDLEAMALKSVGAPYDYDNAAQARITGQIIKNVAENMRMSDRKLAYVGRDGTRLYRDVGDDRREGDTAKMHRDADQ